MECLHNPVLEVIIHVDQHVGVGDQIDLGRRSDVVEKYNLEVALELWRHDPPHVLIAAKAMGEHHTPFTPPADVDVVSRQYIHVWVWSLIAAVQV
jgi:hypothetical protein